MRTTHRGNELGIDEAQRSVKLNVQVVARPAHGHMGGITAGISAVLLPGGRTIAKVQEV